MDKSFLFVHFREKLTPDGEQVYFSVSKDGYNWEEVNGGQPILNSFLGEKGSRDIEIIRKRDKSFVIIATDLCVANRMDENHNIDWKHINHNGSQKISIWTSDDLISFSEQRQLDFSGNGFGCLWAPEIFYDDINDEYIFHWGSTVEDSDFDHMSIFYSKTKDFVEFSKPEIFFAKDNNILDSHITKIADTYHLFYKNSDSPPMNMHETSSCLYGPYTHNSNFDEIMDSLGRPGSYEAATTYILPDGKWCLMLDFFGCERDKMGYVPFVSKKPGSADFVLAKEEFSFPYGFKHGGVIEITNEEYERVKDFYNK